MENNPKNRSSERLTGRRWMAIRERIMARDLYTCQWPGCAVITTDGEVDHKIPLEQGGSDEDNNLQYLCRPHHVTKSNMDQGLRIKVGCDPEGWPIYNDTLTTDRRNET